MTTLETIKSEGPGRPFRRKARKTRPLNRGDHLAGWLFVAADGAGVRSLTLVPLIMALYMSFTDWPRWVRPSSSDLRITARLRGRGILARAGQYALFCRRTCSAEHYFGIAACNPVIKISAEPAFPDIDLYSGYDLAGGLVDCLEVYVCHRFRVH